MDISELKLRKKEIEFCELILSGEKNKEAYLKTFKPKGKNSSESVCKSASRILKKPNVARYMDYLIKQADKKAIITTKRALANISRIAENKADLKDLKAADVLRANESIYKFLKTYEQEEATDEAVGSGDEEGTEDLGLSAVLRYAGQLKKEREK